MSEKLTKARQALLRRLAESVIAAHEAPAPTSQHLMNKGWAEIQRVAGIRFLAITEAGRLALQGANHG